MVKKMHILKNLENFLYDQDYFIDLFNHTLHVYYYTELITLTDTLIELKLKEFILIVEGKDFVVNRLDKHEILIKGIIHNVRFIR